MNRPTSSPILRAQAVLVGATLVFLLCLSTIAQVAARPNAIVVAPTPMVVPLKAKNTLVSQLSNEEGGTYYGCQQAPDNTLHDGSWGHNTCAAGPGGAKQITIFYCPPNDSSCTATDGTNHAYLYNCACSWDLSIWDFWVEFNRGYPGEADSSGTTGQTVVQVGLSIGQTVAQNTNPPELGGPIDPTGYYEAGAFLQ